MKREIREDTEAMKQDKKTTIIFFLLKEHLTTKRSPWK